MQVLIVDDDHLVRKGIISMMPWSEFGLEVAGEAENGAKALAFLDQHPVDLLITDIAMPMMSGIELIRQVREKHPAMAIVVLTFHQDFEYVQEALRLGAIDYIAKVELEKDNMSEVLQRIIQRMRARKRAEPNETDRALLVVARSADADPGALKALLPDEQAARLVEMSRQSWLLTKLQPLGEADIAHKLYDEQHMQHTWALVRLDGLDGHNGSSLFKHIDNYMRNVFFYEHDKQRHMYEATGDELALGGQPLKEKELFRLKDRWSSLDLVYDNSRFAELLAELRDARPSTSKLESMFYSILRQWETYTPQSLTELFDADSLRFWSDWVDWLHGIRETIRGMFAQAHYSDEVMAGIMRAVDYINQHISVELKLTEVAEEAHISRSYFSECFKNITGRTFNDYIRDVRVDLAERLLEQTNEPIYKVAEKCGYPDEKYFSKIFRKKTGKLPSEYRKAKTGGKSY